jgi:hypothetical protein
LSRSTKITTPDGAAVSASARRLTRAGLCAAGRAVKATHLAALGVEAAPEGAAACPTSALRTLAWALMFDITDAREATRRPWHADRANARYGKG